MKRLVISVFILLGTSMTFIGCGNKLEEAKSFPVCMLADDGMYNITKKSLGDIEISFTNKYKEASFISFTNEDTYVIDMTVDNELYSIRTKLQELDSGKSCLSIYEVKRTRNNKSKMLDKKQKAKILQELNNLSDDFVSESNIDKNINMCVVLSDTVAFYPSTMEDQINRDNVRHKRKNDEKVVLTYVDDRDTKLVDVIAQKIELRNGRACYALLKVYDYSTGQYSQRVASFGQSVYGKSLKKERFKYEDIVKIGSTVIDMKEEKDKEEKAANLKREKEALLAKLALTEKQNKEKAEKLLTSKLKDVKDFALCMPLDGGMYDLTKKSLTNIEIDFTKQYETSSFTSYQSKDTYVINMSANKRSHLIKTKLHELNSGKFCLSIYEVISSKNNNNTVLDKKGRTKLLQELHKI